MPSRLSATLPDHLLGAAPSPGEFRTLRLSSAVLRMKLKRLAMNGKNATEASRIVGCAPATAQAIWRDPLFRREVREALGRVWSDVDEVFEETHKDLYTRISEAATEKFPDFLNIIEDTGNDLTTFQRAKLITDLMDRVPEAAKHSHSHTSNVSLQTQDLQRAAQGAREMENVLPIKKRSA